MIRRLAIALLLCGGLGFFLHREMERGTFDPWHRAILRELQQWQGAPPAAPVILVELRRGDLPFESWPPAPMDYALIFESLVRREPRAVAVQSLLDWPSVEALDAATLAERIALLPRGVLACALSSSSLTFGDLPLPLAPLPQVGSGISALPAFTGVGQAPIDDVRGGKATGFTRIEFGENPQAHETEASIPLLAQKDGKVYPSLMLQALLAWEGRGSDDAHITLGREIIISPALRLPIDHAGRFSLAPRLAEPIQRVDAGSLLLDLEKDASLLQSQPEELAALRGLKGALLVLGEAGENTPRFAVGRGVEWTEAELFAQGLRAALSGQHLREPRPRSQWLVWALAGTGGLLLLFSPRQRLAIFALGGAAAIALGLILAFLYGRWWLPPVPPLALWSAAALAAALLPPAKASEKTPAAEAATPPSPEPAITATKAAEAPAAPSQPTQAIIETAGLSSPTSAPSENPSVPPAETNQLPATPAPAPDDASSQPTPPASDAETEEEHTLVHQLLEETDASADLSAEQAPAPPPAPAEPPPPATLLPALLESTPEPQPAPGPESQQPHAAAIDEPEAAKIASPSAPPASAALENATQEPEPPLPTSADLSEEGRITGESAVPPIDEPATAPLVSKAERPAATKGPHKKKRPPHSSKKNAPPPEPAD